MKKRAVGAKNEWLWAHDWNEAMVAEAGLRKYVLARLGENDCWGEEGDGSRRVARGTSGHDGQW